MCNTWSKVLREILQPLILAQIVKQCNRCFKREFYAAICCPRIEHTLDDLISFCVNAVVLAAAQILQVSWRLLFEFTARFASLFEMSDKQDDFAANMCCIVPAD